MLLSKFQKKNTKGKEKENGNLLFYQFIMTPYYYDSPKKKSLYTPCIAFTHLLYIPFIHPLYYNHLFTHFTTTIFASFIIFTLYVSPYQLSIYNTSIVSLILFYFKICISSSCLNQGTNSFSHKGGRIVMIPNHAQPAYTQGRMHRRFLSTYRYAARRESARRVRINTPTCVNSHALINLRKSPRQTLKRELFIRVSV